jgi:hypothetical protein
MSVALRELLEHVLEGEPTLGDEVDAVFRRAARLRRRRTRALIVTGCAAVAAIGAAGYLLTTTLLPGTAPPAPVAAAPSVTTSAVPVPSSIADPVLAVIAPFVDDKKMAIRPRPPERGNGWRQYSVLDEDGKARGTVEVAVYPSPDDLCFPVLAASGKCARTEWAPRGIEYVRYDDDQDLDWQVHQTIARRISDGRTVSVMATGERGTDDADEGKPPLTGKEVEKIATDPRLGDAFGPDEGCTGPSADACPVFRVLVPIDRD